jgi:hypothetical protein
MTAGGDDTAQQEAIIDPTYQAMMAQQLMGGATAAPGMSGQNASTPYGASFVLGNSAMPQMQGQAQQGAPQMQGRTPYGMLNNSASQVLQQPLAAY